jgi:hypothetical protein
MIVATNIISCPSESRAKRPGLGRRENSQAVADKSEQISQSKAKATKARNATPMTRSKMYTTTLSVQRATRRNCRKDRLLGHGSGEQFELDSSLRLLLSVD